MKPIVLTSLGETLLPQYNIPEEVDETSLLRKYEAVGMHKFCGNWVYIRDVAEFYSAIFCNGCNMRVAIPKNVITFGDLRRHCERD